MHLLVQRSRSSAKVKIKYKGYISQKMAVSGAFMFHKHMLFFPLLSSMSSFSADNGSLYFWDWKTGYNFQRIQAAVQPGSIDSEAGIFAMAFDQSNTRLITAEADKTIKIYKEDDTAVSTV